MTPIQDENLIPKRDQMLVEPIFETRLSIVSNIISTNDTVPATMKAKVIKFGPVSRDPGFVVGDIVMIVPHSGYKIPMADEAIERLVIPIDQTLGVFEE
jgi:hypothetical protein